MPPAPDGPVPADARAVTASAVISPLKIERLVTTLSACAAATVVTAVVALAVIEPARTIEPSDGKMKLPADGAACGGDVTDGEARGARVRGRDPDRPRRRRGAGLVRRAACLGGAEGEQRERQEQHEAAHEHLILPAIPDHLLLVLIMILS